MAGSAPSWLRDESTTVQPGEPVRITDVGEGRNQYRNSENSLWKRRLDDSSLRSRRGGVLDIPEPQLQHQEFPEVVIIIAAAAIMLI